MSTVYQLVRYIQDFDTNVQVKHIKNFSNYDDLYNYAIVIYMKELNKKNDFTHTDTNMRYRKVNGEFYTESLKFLDINCVRKYLDTHNIPEMKKYIADYDKWKNKRASILRQGSH